MAPDNRKRKQQDASFLENGSNPPSKRHFPNPPGGPPTDEDRKTWRGFCEIENEPAFFSVMLREFGVKGVKVQEVFGLDDEMLAMLPQPVHGLIFLFRYRSDDETKQEATCPEHVWFANQTHENACATVSLLNIINNIPNADLGDNLRNFKEFSADFPPALRGDAIGDFEFVKQIHNSFARKMDMLNADLALENEYDDRKKPKRKLQDTKTRGNKTSQQVDEDADGAFHFIAYVPIYGEVWKLDGLDRQPQNLGLCSKGEWLSLVRPVLQERMAEYEEGQIEFGLLGVVQDPIVDHQKQLANDRRSMQAIETRLDELFPDWRSKILTGETNGIASLQNGDISALDQSCGITNEMLEAAVVPQSVKERLKDECPETIMKLWQESDANQKSIRNLIRDEQSSNRDDDQRAWERRQDYGPMIKTWLEMLAQKEGLIKELIEETR